MEDEVKGESAGDPHKLITKCHVGAALKEDKGTEAKLLTFEIQDFTKKGDNLATFVTSIKVKYSIQEEVRDVTYVVKVNPCRDLEVFNELANKLFVGEGGFYMDVAPDIRSILESSGWPPLGIAKCFHVSKEVGKEVLFLEDLRSRGFKMTDRKKGLDFAHTSLVIKQLATLHSSSYLLIKKYCKEEFADRYKSMKLTAENTNPQEAALMDRMFRRSVEGSKEMLNKIGGYEKAMNWMEKHMGGLTDLMYHSLRSSPPFDVVCHGDLWTNNMMFRYDEEDHPVEMMMVDLQITRLASLSADLNHFFFSNLTGDVRQPNLHKFLDTYFETFSAIVEAGGQRMPFNMEEFLQEFKDKHEYGLLFAILVVPIIVLDSNEAPDAEDLFEVKSEEMEAKFIQEQASNLNSNPLLKPRFLAFLNEMEEAGVFD